MNLRRSPSAYKTKRYLLPMTVQALATRRGTLVSLKYS
jgi:hypothetical protein